MKNTLILLVIISLFTTISAQTVNVVLKNSKVVMGEVVQEDPEYLIIFNDTGQIKINRQSIESVTYIPTDKLESLIKNMDDKSKNNAEPFITNDNIVLDDLVVIYLKNDDIVSGRLLAKSLNMILVQTESGSLTIPKRELQRIEYISSEYAERGEVVIAYLSNGTKFEGNIYFEDYQNLVLDTKIGRLTIDKNNLRSIEYTGEKGRGDETLVEQYAAVTKDRSIVAPRIDVLSLGYAPSFGAEYSSGFALGYASKFLLSHMEGFYISGIGGLNLTYFTLNEDNFKDEVPTVAASGGTFMTTISAGASFTLYQQAAAKYEFYISPQLEANMIYKNLEKDFPSFPTFNSKVISTEFVFGIGNKIGVDILFGDMKVGVSYDSHFLFGDEDYNMLSINFTKKLF